MKMNPGSRAGEAVISTHQLLEAVDTLGKLIEDNEDALRVDAELHPINDDSAAAADFADDGIFATPQPRRRTPHHLDLFDIPAAPFDEPLDESMEEDLVDDEYAANSDAWSREPDVETLKQELIGDLNALIEIGLRRVTDSAREHMAQEFSQQLSGNSPTSSMAPARSPVDDVEDAMSLSQAVGDLLSRYGLADRGHDAFYCALKTELDKVVSKGIEQIRRELEQVLQARLAARAEQQWEALSASRDRQEPEQQPPDWNKMLPAQLKPPASDDPDEEFP
jgi:hypothetical protein